MVRADVGALFGANLAAALQRSVGGAGVLDVYASQGLALTHAVGPVSGLDRGPSGVPLQYCDFTKFSR